MHRPKQLTTLALTGVLALGLTACGSDAEPADPTTSAPATTQEDEGGMATDDATTTGEAGGGALGDGAVASDGAAGTDGADGTDGTDGADGASGDAAGSGGEVEAAAGVPALKDIWPAAIENIQGAKAVDASVSGADEQMSVEATIKGQLDDSNYQLDATIDGADVSAMVDGEDHFVKGSEEYWSQAGAPDPAKLADTWIQVPPEMGMTDALSVSKFWKDFFADAAIEPEALVASAAEKTDLDGVPAYHYTSHDGAEIWFTADGEDNLLKLVFEDPQMTEPLKLDIRAIDDVPKVDPPQDATPMDEVMGQSR